VFSKGSMYSPPFIIPKCKWGPVEYPVFPLNPNYSSKGQSGPIEVGKMTKEIKKLDEQLSEFGLDTPDEARKEIKKLEGAIADSTKALLEMNRAEDKELATKSGQIRRVTELRDRYTELSEKESLNAAGKAELVSVVKALKDLYPSLIAQMDEEGRMQILNIDNVESRIDAEKNVTDAMMEGRKNQLAIEKQKTQDLIDQARERLKVLQTLAEAGGESAASKKLNDAISNVGVRKYLPNQQPDTRLQLPQTLLQNYMSTQQENKRNDELASKINQAEKEIEEGFANLAEIERRMRDIDTNSFEDEFGEGGPAGNGGGGDLAKKAQEVRQKNFQNEMASIQFKTEMYEWSAEQQIEALEKVREKHKRHLSETIEDERMVALEIKHLEDDIAAERVAINARAREKQFQHSLDWIEQEKYYKRLSLEEELAAWQRVQARYDKGSKERIKAEREVFRVEQELNDQREQMVKELERTRRRSQLCELSHRYPWMAGSGLCLSDLERRYHSACERHQLASIHMCKYPLSFEKGSTLLCGYRFGS
jgi:hypothetical protein